MEPLLLKGRYKIITKLFTDHNYAALEAVDIYDSAQPSYLLNVYEGDYRKQYITALTSLKHCADYVGSFNYMESYVAVFKIHGGKSIDQVFYKGAEHDWQTRLFYADKLFEHAINAADFPPEVSCPAFLSENILINANEEALELNYMLRPMLGCSERELILLLTDQLNKIFIKRYGACNKELEFMGVLKRGGYESLPEIYAYWRQMKLAIGAQYTAIYKKNALMRSLYMFFINVGRLFTRVGR